MASVGASIGSAYLRVGADTSDFQAKLAAGTVSFNRFTSSAAAQGKAASAGLLATGAAAGEVGRRLSSMAFVLDSVAGTSVSAYTQMGHAALTMTKSVVQGTGALLSMQTATSSVSSVLAAFGAGPVAGLVVTAAAAGAAIGTLLNKASGIGEVFSTAMGPITEYGKVLAASEERFQSAAAQYDHMRQSLKLTGPEWDFQAVRTKENAQRLAELIDRVTQEAAVIKATKVTRDGYTQYYLDLGNKIRANQQILATYTEQVNKYYGIVTKTEASDQLKKTVVDLQVMAKEGVDAQQIIEKAGPKILEVVETAKKMGLDIPPVVANMAEAIKSKNDLWVGDIVASMNKVPEALRATSAANAAELARVEAQFQSGVKGGFEKGTREGLDVMQQQIADEAAKLKITIPVEFAAPDLENFVRSIVRGERKNLGGSVGAGG